MFGTLHTTTAASTVDRVIDQFPADRQAQIRIMLSESLRGVIAQTLCRKIGGGRVAALEVLIATQAISNLIREGKTFQIPSIMQVNKAHGMVTLNDALMDLVTKKVVGPSEQADRWGTVTVNVTVRLTSVGKKTTRKYVDLGGSYSYHTDRSQFIMSQALPILKSEALRAQSASIDMVSGATDSSEAFAESLQSAILKAKRA